jgi:hypothetical protein
VTADDLREWINRRPFEPFELITTEGERHVVKHPEFALISPTRSVVMDPMSDRFAFVSLLHVTEVRPLEPQSV